MERELERRARWKNATKEEGRVRKRRNGNGR